MTDAADTDPLPDVAAFRDAAEELGRPVLTAGDVARALDLDRATAEPALVDLADGPDLERVDVERDPVVYYTTAWGTSATRERPSLVIPCATTNGRPSPPLR